MHVPGVGFTKSCALSGLAELARFGFGDFLGVFGATQMVEFERFISCFLAISSDFLLGFPEKEPISLFGGKSASFCSEENPFCRTIQVCVLLFGLGICGSSLIN